LRDLIVFYHISCQLASQNQNSPKQGGIKMEQADLPALQETPSTMVPLAVDDAVEAFEQYQELRNKLGDERDFVTIRGKEHPKKSWANKLARFFGISIEILDEEWESDDNGDKTCKIMVRAAMPNGMSRDATGSCDSTEKQEKQATTHNIRAHASTRAKNRAILELVGFGEVSAEEISADEYDQKPTPQNGQITKHDGNGKDNIDKARKMTFALAGEKGLKADKFIEEAFKQYCYETFDIESRKELTIEQFRELYRTLRDDDRIVNEIKLNGKRIEVEALIEDIVEKHETVTEDEIKLRLLDNLNSINEADMDTLEGWVETLCNLKDNGNIAEYINREPPF